MSSTRTSSTGNFELNATPLIVSAILIAAGSAIGITGLIVGGATMFSATRKWVNQMDVPPTEVVKQKLAQTKAATTAGATAWQSHNGMARSGRG
jgi:hypothetical protein